MSPLSVLTAFAFGTLFGLLLAYVLRVIQSRSAAQLAQELFRESEEQRRAVIDGVLERVKNAFESLSLSALSKSTEEFLKLAGTRMQSERELAGQEMESKKSLIEKQIEGLNAELGNLSKMVQELERDRIEKFGQLSMQLKSTGEQTSALMQSTNSLREALSSTKARGQWGERMADDVLRMCGFREDINYHRQKTGESGSRPDFTFLLPRDLKLNMDVKFPLDNYLKYLDAGSDLEKKKYRDLFLRNVRDKMKEVTGREYINTGQNTVDYVILFIPNESIYTFIHEQDVALFDDGLKNKVIFCSPVTLFAVLGVIRHAIDNFALERTSGEILQLLGGFSEQWTRFVDQMEKLGRRIEDVQKEYEALVVTRRKQLERPLDKIASLRSRPQEEAGGDIVNLPGIKRPDSMAEGG